LAPGFRILQRSMLMIELSDIEIKYGDFIAIKGLNLTIKEGEFFTFLGSFGVWENHYPPHLGRIHQAKRG